MSNGAALPEPLAQGDLARTPFAHLLLYIQKRALDGTLVIWRTQTSEERPPQDRIRFQGGSPVAVRLFEPASRIERGLLPLFARADGPYAFYEHTDLVRSGPGVREGTVDLLVLITASLRGSSRDDVVARVCEGLGESKLRLVPGVDLDRFGFLPAERGFVDLMRAEPTTVEKLAEASTLPPRMAERLVYLLTITKSIAPWDGSFKDLPTISQPPPALTPEPEAPKEPPRPPASAPKTAEGPPSSPAELSPEHRALRDEIVKRNEEIERENYFEMLGLLRDAPASSVQKAYFQAVKKWHPDRVPKELAALRPAVETIFRHLTRAQETLSDDAKRGLYISQMQDGGGTPEAERKLGMIVQAAMDFRMVEVHMRRREYGEALKLLDQILAINDEDPDYHATRGWILFQQHPNDTSMRTTALAAIDRALLLSEKHDKAHYYKGMMLERAGRTREAQESFKKAVQLNPRNIEAARMVRLGEMRAKDEPAAPRKGDDPRRTDSLLSKLFNKKP